uniref:Uncharacterized protein n=1 Tax=Leersia perrieri TaxID=77586 RepID=A0A0D9WA29_9ORYZ
MGMGARWRSSAGFLALEGSGECGVSVLRVGGEGKTKKEEMTPLPIVVHVEQVAILALLASSEGEGGGTLPYGPGTANGTHMP